MQFEGHWEGYYVSEDTQGKVRWQSAVTLDVPEQTPFVQEGRFTLKENGKGCATRVKIQDAEDSVKLAKRVVS